MGLKSGETGAKSYLKEKCPPAFRTYDSLYATRNDVGAKRTQTALLIDGNVLLMGLPESVATLAGCVKVILNQLEAALGTSWLTILVFDEPAAMTMAKKAEQARRDATRTAKAVPCSNDIDLPKTDDFTREELAEMPNIFPLRDHRPTRSRLYDEIIRQVYLALTERVDKWNQNENPDFRTVIVFDGVDLRGCDRPVGEKRNVAMSGSDASVVENLKRDKAVGEGDLKLQLLDERIRALAVEGGVCEGTNLILTSTIDTDSMMIATLGVSRRRVNPVASSCHSLLCMRSPASKRQREADANAKATYLCVDVAMLEGLMQAHMWKGRVVEPQEALNAMLTLAAGAALCGCDFVFLRGLRFDHLWDSLPEYIANEPLSLSSFGKSINASIVNETKRGVAARSLTRVCVNASRAMEEKPRYKKQAQAVFEVDDATLRRAMWTACYWNLNEHEANLLWGFEPLQVPTHG